MSNLSDAQRLVAESAERTFVVRASAGSGKTRALVARYLKRVVDDGASPDQLLTVTFTKKAAAEMKERIVAALVQAGLTAEAQIAETGPIQTLHSFCERVIRENALAIGIDPDFTMLNEGQARRWVREAIDASLDRLSTEPFVAAFLQRFAGKQGYATTRGGEAARMVGQALGALRGSQWTAETLLEGHADPAAYLVRSREAVLSAMDPAARSAFEGGAHGADFWTRVLAAFKSSKVPAPSWCPRPTSAAVAEPGETLAAELACGLAHCAADAWRRLEERMRESQSFDFALMERIAARAIERPEIAERLRRQYSDALIDEAQDLNPVQVQLLRSLRPERLVYVGDAQQSIYSFRQSDVRLFIELSQAQPTLNLPQNYRTEPAALQVIDDLFGKLWFEDYTPMLGENLTDSAAEPAVELWDLKEKDSARIAETIADWIGNAPYGDVAILMRGWSEIEVLRGRLEILGVPCRVAGGSKFFTRMEVRDFANALTAAVDPSNDFALLAALRSPIVGLKLETIVRLAATRPVISALKSLDIEDADERDKIERFLEWFEPISRVADRRPAWETLGAILAKSPYAEQVIVRPSGRRQLANVRKLLALAAEFEESSAREFAVFMREIQELGHNEGDASAVDESEPAVTLMTIHKSKGLEFPHVVVPDLFKKVETNAKPLEIDRDAGLIGIALSKESTIVRDWIAFRRKAQEREEGMRLLYVALTRARKRIAVAGHASKNGSLGQAIWQALGVQKGAPAPRGARIRWLDDPRVED